MIRIWPVLFLCLAGAQAAPAVFDRVVAVVDEEIILWSDVEKLDEALRFQPPFSMQSEEERRGQILQRLIDDKVLLAAATRDTTIVVSDKEVETQAKSHLDRLLEQYGGEDRLGTALQQSEGLTLAEFRERMKREVREQMQKQRLQQKFVGEVAPSNQDVRSFYESYRDSLPVLSDNYHVSHLEMAIQPDSVGDRHAWRLCDSLISLLGKGVAFDYLAQKFSDDPGGAEGGDLGYTRRGTLDPEYEKAAFALNLGEYTLRPVRSQYGWHVIKLTGRKDTEVRTSHILVMVVPTAADTLRTLARLDSIRNTALTQNNFAALATRFSEDQKTASAGGGLGWFTGEQLSGDYKDIIDTLASGGISAPVAVNGKYHLFRLDEKLDERRPTLEADWDQLAALARNQIQARRLETHMERWRTQVHIENRLSVTAAPDGK